MSKGVVLPSASSELLPYLTSYQPNALCLTLTMHEFNFNNLAGGGWTETLDAMTDLDAWKSAPDLKTLFSLNRAYLRGEMDLHPAHPGGVDEETSGIKQSLLTMNEYSMFTFQGQPRNGSAGFIPPHCPCECGDEDINPTDTEAWCRSCAMPCCFDHEQWTEVRLLPFVQFCLPIGGEGIPTVAQAAEFARTLLQNHRLHTLISWPKDLEVPNKMEWRQADLSTATYIPQPDLDLFAHYTSKHGSSCAYKVRTAPSRVELAFKAGGWRTAGGRWSQVNDYHLLRPRVPNFFLGPEAKTIVFGVNSTTFEGVKDLETNILDIARQCGMSRCFPNPDIEEQV